MQATNLLNHPKSAHFFLSKKKSPKKLAFKENTLTFASKMI
jgi:hypothetical protein